MSLSAMVVSPAIGEVMETMYFLEPAYKGVGKPEGPVLGASLRFAGTFEGEFCVAVSRETASRMTAEFLVAESDEITTTQSEATVRELANVACGAVLSRWMPDGDFRFAIPALLGASDAERTLHHCFALEGEAIEMGFDVTFDRMEPGQSDADFAAGSFNDRTSPSVGAI